VRPLQQGGLRVTTTLDWKLQQIAEKVGQGSRHRAPQPRSEGVRQAPRFDDYPAWIRNLETRTSETAHSSRSTTRPARSSPRSDRRTTTRTSKDKRFQPQFDVVDAGLPPAGSAFKPFNYVTGIDDGATSPASDTFMDVATDFGGGYTPERRRQYERGRSASADALQFSLNIRASRRWRQQPGARVRAGEGLRDDLPERDDRRRDWPSRSASPRRVRSTSSRLSGTLANGGVQVEQTSILTIQDRVWQGRQAPGRRRARAGRQAAVRRSSSRTSCSGNTNPRINPFWGKFPDHRPRRRPSPATLKTGTNNDAKDLNAYGYIAPADQGGPAGRRVRACRRRLERQQRQHARYRRRLTPSSPIDVPTFEWQGSSQEATAKWPITRFDAP
jgi:membrane peptidoglycan carboxypeptidase